MWYNRDSSDTKENREKCVKTIAKAQFFQYSFSKTLIFCKGMLLSVHIEEQFDIEGTYQEDSPNVPNRNHYTGVN